MTTGQTHILVVDDDLDLRDMVEESLRQTYGHENVRTASNGQEALDRFAEEVPDILITDERMPKIGGFELTRRIRANPQYRHITIIMQSGSASRKEALEAGANELVEKPFTLAELQAAIDKLVKIASTLPPPEPA